MYKLKEKLPIENQRQFAKVVGIAPETLSNIQSKRVTCRKVVAYCITKNFNSELEINDLFDVVE